MKIIGCYICVSSIAILSTAGFAAEPVLYENNAGAEWFGIAVKYEDCLQSKSQSLDDGISDAGTIGGQVWAECRPAAVQFASAYASMPNVSFGEKVAMWWTVFTQGKDIGAKRVIKNRTVRSN